ncbi:hypothetical protein DI383_12000 [Flavobacteriaceae bacterium LYZ1037]|nr:hypothetical protein DI383_12000 [Flavobacteriaceae bacterium LYZ1037]
MNKNNLIIFIKFKICTLLKHNQYYSLLRSTLFILILLITSYAKGQNKDSEIDSLKNVIKTSANDSVKMITYNALRRATYYTDAETSKTYTKNYLELATKLKDSHHIALGRFFLGNAEVLAGNYDTALSNYIIAGNYYEKEKDSSRLCSVLNSIGAVYEKTRNDSLSLLYYKRSLKISKSISDNRRSGIASINIGNIYNELGDIDTSITFLEDAISDLSIDPNHQSFLILGEVNLANAYGQNKEYKKAFNLYQEILKKVDTIKDVYNQANVLRGISDVFVHQKEYKNALPYAEKAFRIFNENNFTDDSFQLIPELIEIHEANGNYKEAVTLYSKYTKIKDSLFTETKDKNIAEAVQKYETEKKDAELKLLKLEGEKKDQQNKLYIALAFAGLLIAGLLGFFGYKNMQKNTVLAKQKKLLEATLSEKNTLLKEVHHRVKNSFQIVSSLLYLQSENTDDKEAKIAIKEAENRVRSMVLVHQKLYNKEELVGINTKEYITDLVKDIFESHQFQKKPIAYQLDVESLVLDIESITPIGLILNELIINALKHAFQDVTDKSELKVLFSKENNELVLKVIDNGKGFEGEIKNSSFGITLMNALSKKLKATLSYVSAHNKGTEAVLKIKKFNILS